MSSFKDGKVFRTLGTIIKTFNPGTAVGINLDTGTIADTFTVSYLLISWKLPARTQSISE